MTVHNESYNESENNNRRCVCFNMTSKCNQLLLLLLLLPLLPLLIESISLRPFFNVNTAYAPLK